MHAGLLRSDVGGDVHVVQPDHLPQTLRLLAVRLRHLERQLVTCRRKVNSGHTHGIEGQLMTCPRKVSSGHPQFRSHSGQLVTCCRTVNSGHTQGIEGQLMTCPRKVSSGHAQLRSHSGQLMTCRRKVSAGHAQRSRSGRRRWARRAQGTRHKEEQDSR